MPRQNRVTPYGDIIATPLRGTFFGNRGIIHDHQARIVRPWKLKRWLVCVLEFRGRHRQVMTPDRYTELFFLDEATALAAGHRPCAECRRQRFMDYCQAWKNASRKNYGADRPRVDEIDNQLHAERLTASRSKRTFIASVDTLPDGVFVTLNNEVSDSAYLMWHGSLLLWSPGGYTKRLRLPRKKEAFVLTPRTTVAVIKAGYVPEVHFSADGLR
jgi:hypothetical protein